MAIQKIPSSAFWKFSCYLNSSLHTSEYSDHRPKINLSITFPFIFSPRIKQFNNSFFLLSFFCFDKNLFDIENSICMLRYQTQIFISIIVLCWTTNKMIFIIMLCKEIPRYLFVNFFVWIFAQIFVRSSCKWAQCMTCKSRLNSLIWAINFCISLLQ